MTQALLRRRLRGSQGAAVAESTMIMALLALIFASIMQLGVVIYTHNTLVDAASAGARHAALADRTVDDGVHRTRQLIASSIPRANSADVAAGVHASDTEEDAQIVVVTVRHRMPLLGFVTGPVGMEVSGHAYAYP